MSESPDRNTASQLAKPQEDLSTYCPNCSAKLKESRCKLVCKQCGFFLSCADFY